MAPHGEEDGGGAQQQGEEPLVALEAERHDGGDQEQRRQPVEPRRRQAEAEQHGRAGEQDDEDRQQDAEPPLAVRPPPSSFLRLLRFTPRHHVASHLASLPGNRYSSSSIPSRLKCSARPRSREAIASASVSGVSSSKASPPWSSARTMNPNIS